MSNAKNIKMSKQITVSDVRGTMSGVDLLNIDDVKDKDRKLHVILLNTQQEGMSKCS